MKAMSFMKTLGMTQLSRLKDVAIGAGGGSSLGAFLAWVAKDYFLSNAAQPESWESVAATTLAVGHSEFIHWPSLGLGVVLGFLLWPILEFLYLWKQYLTLWLRLSCQNLLRGNKGDSLHRKL